MLSDVITTQSPHPDGYAQAGQPGHWLSVVTHLDPRFGGLSSVVPHLGTVVTAEGRWQVSLAAFCSPGELYSLANYGDSTLTEWPASRGAWLRNRALQSRFHGTLRDIEGLHIHGLWELSTAVAARAARARALPYIVSAHGMLERWALKNKLWKKRLYSALVERANLRGAACLHALTHAEAGDYRRYGCRNPIAVIPNGVRLPETLSSSAFLAQHPSLKGKRIVLFLGRIHFKKGLDLLIPAFKALISRHPEAHLVLAGPDFEGTRARVAAQIAEEGIGNHVLFAGMLRDELKWSALAAAECYVLPSYSEGLSVSVLEAMGVGLPVVITEHCNLPEVAELEAGWVVAAERGPLESALGEVLANTPAANRAIGAQGRRFVAERFSWHTIARQMSELYSWVAGGALPSSVEILHAGGRP